MAIPNTELSLQDACNQIREIPKAPTKRRRRLPLKRFVPHPVEVSHVVLQHSCRMPAIGEEAMDSDIDLQQKGLPVVKGRQFHLKRQQNPHVSKR